MPKKNIIIDPKLCTGCRICENTCSMKFEKKFNPRRSRIKIVKMFPGLVDMPTVCRQCANAPCMSQCPFDAISENDKTGAKIVNEDKCTGCGMCVDACPFGAVIVHSEKGKAIKCNLCNGDPLCVRSCPTGALLYGPPEIAGQKKRTSTAVTMSKELSSLLKT